MLQLPPLPAPWTDIRVNGSFTQPGVAHNAYPPPVVGVFAGFVRQQPNPAASWLQEPSWQQLLHLSALPAFAGIADAVAADPSAWQAVYNAPEPHKATLPGMYSRLEEFRQLLVLRCVHSPPCFLLALLECGRLCTASASRVVPCESSTWCCHPLRSDAVVAKKGR